MNAQQILDFVRMMACSQGFYCRVLEALKENPEFLQELVDQHFNDSLDLVLYLEQ